MSERPLDVLVWGATGFTGRLVAEYLAERHGKGELRWGLAGRSREKLEGVRRALASSAPALADLPLVIADASDPASLRAMAAQTRVVCATAGPFAIHGSEVVAACVREGADYCDITGETQWIRRMIDLHHAEAQKRGLKIVHCCGFDSIPSDLGAQMMVEHLREQHGQATASVRAVFGPARGGVSGGTIASMVNVLEQAMHDRALRRLLANPYSLNPEGVQGPDSPDQKGPARDEALGVWTAPFVMAAINTRIVRRSNALLEGAYGSRFHYNESMGAGAGPVGLLKATSIASGMAAVLGGAAVPPLRSAMRRFLPEPGQGPSAEARKNGFFKVRLVAEGEGGKRLFGTVIGQQDPGYGETAKMISEAALCLALDREKLSPLAGVLTPASAMGRVLRERLVRAGMTFRVD